LHVRSPVAALQAESSDWPAGFEIWRFESGDK
jgi:hypothetical protein